MVDYFKVCDAVFWLASLFAMFIISLFHLYYRFYFYSFQCFGSRLGLLVCKITPLGFCSTLLPTLFTPSGKYLFVPTQQIHWSCLVILLTFFLYLWLTSFLSAGGLLSQYSSSCCRKNDFNLHEMKTFMEKREQKNKIMVKSEDCPQLQVRWNRPSKRLTKPAKDQTNKKSN